MSTTTTKYLRRPLPKPSGGRSLWLGAALCLLLAVPLTVGQSSASPAPAARPPMGHLGCGGSTTGAGSEEPTGPHIAKIRVANFYLNANGTPGAALDLYDAPHPSNKDKPLISGLVYGRVSSYVSPRAEGPPKYFTGNDYGNLYIFQHGCRTWGGQVDGMQSGTNVSNAGWVNGEQETLVISDGFDGLAPQPSFSTVNEVEPKGDGYSMIIKPSSGMGMLVVNSAGLVNGEGKVGNAYIRVDGRCPDNALVAGETSSNNSDSPVPLGSSAADNFPLRPGSHKLEVVASSAPGLGLAQSQCDAAPALGTTTLKISGSAPSMLFLYGPSPQHVRFLVTAVG